MPTRIRVKLDFVFVVPTDPLTTNIPLINGKNVTDLILYGLIKMVPTAIAILPGTHADIHNVDFVKALRAQNKQIKADKRVAKAANRNAPETVPGTPLAPGRSTVVHGRRR